MSLSASSTYLEQCQQMSFAELRRYIDEMLSALAHPLPPTRRGPRSRDEFLALVRLLQNKISEPPWLPPPPTTPALAPIPPEPEAFPDYTASESLFPLAQFRDIEQQIRAKRSDPKATKRSIKKLEHKLEFMRKTITPLLEQEKRDIAHHNALRDAHFRPYQTALAAHQNAPRTQEAWIQSHRAESDRIRENHKKKFSVLQRFVDRIRRDTDAAFAFGAPVQTLSWRVLPPGEWTLDSIFGHYENLERSNPHIRYDVERLRRIFSLRPSTCYIGVGEFDGYIVFAFPHTQKVALECPIYGNAIYVIRSGWQALSRLTKYELLTKHAHLTTRIIHTGKWFQRLKAQLR